MKANELWKKIEQECDKHEFKEVKDEQCCPNRNVLTREDGNVCSNCGTFEYIPYFHDVAIQDGNQPRYKKKDYFKQYFTKLENKSLFPLNKHRGTLDNIFDKNKTYDCDDIKEVLHQNKLSGKLLRYMPEIFYYLNPNQPKITLNAHSRGKIFCEYNKILNYATKNNISLPNSKCFFALKLIEKHSPENKETAKKIIPRIRSKKIRLKYRNIFKEVEKI